MQYSFKILPYKMGAPAVGSPHPTITFEDGLAFHRQGRLDEAKKAYLDVIKRDPLHADALHHLGIIEYQEKDYRKALELINRAIHLDANNASSHSNLGNVLKEMQRYPDALDSYNRAIDLNPEIPQVLSNRGNVLKELAMFDEALQSYGRAIELAPDYAEAYFNRGVLLQHLEQLENAMHNYGEAIAINASYAQAYSNRGNILRDMGKLEAALEDYDAAIKIDQGLAEVHLNRGNTFKDLKRYVEALASYDRAIQLDDKLAGAYSGLGSVHYVLNRYQEAIVNYCAAIDLDPENRTYWSNFCLCVPKIQVNAQSSVLADYINRSLEQTNIAQPANLLPSIVSALDSNHNIARFLELSWSGTPYTAINELVEDISNVSLLIGILKLTPFVDVRYEHSLTATRRWFLNQCVVSPNQAPVPKLLYGLAHQCFINEYVYYQTEEERKLVELLEIDVANACRGNALDRMYNIVVLATYKALNEYSWANSLLKLDQSADYQNLMKLQVANYQEEQSIRSSIPRIGQVEDVVSKEVRAQYELNPYPRWVATQLPVEPMEIGKICDRLELRRDVEFAERSGTTEILVAGCGTGRHSILTAARFAHSKVTAIDLSLSSLSYAARMTKELGIKNVKYAHADILGLRAIDKQFDIVESVGVLHHMAHPLEGWKVLVDRTKTGGLMRIGLYSEIARKSIVLARELIKNEGLENTAEDIRMFRYEILNSDSEKFRSLRELVQINDFFTTSECRDLLFHVQEHRFTLLQIEDILQELGLTFIGFEFPDNHVKDSFKHQFPEGSEYSLTDWHRFELDNPTSFLGMYQFWLQKTAPV